LNARVRRLNRMVNGMVSRMVSLVALLIVAPVALAQTVPPPDAPKAAVAAGYSIGVGDSIEVSVIGRPEYTSRVQVQVDGTVQLPYINNVTAANKTLLQLRDEVKRALMAGGFYADPAVNVAVVSYASRYVVVLGDVAQPGIVPIDRSYRVSEILARVGGVRESGGDTLTLRHEGGAEIKLPIRAIAVGGPADDPLVMAGDKLFVPAAENFYIYGQVNAPGTYRLQTGMTLRMALARGGGLNDRGSERRLKVFRDGKEVTRIDLSEPIRPGDVVNVGARLF
jgi:polysaccharide biosynthesis/export protein